MGVDVGSMQKSSLRSHGPAVGVGLGVGAVVGGGAGVGVDVGSMQKSSLRSHGPAVGVGLGVGAVVGVAVAVQSKGTFGSQSSACAQAVGESGAGKRATNASVAADNTTGATTQIKSEASQPLRSLPTIRGMEATLQFESLRSCAAARYDT